VTAHQQHDERVVRVGSGALARLGAAAGEYPLSGCAFAAAARLLGAECTISGIRPQVAQTIVSLGIEFGDIATKATLADALTYALRRSGQVIGRKAGQPGEA